MTHRDDNGFCDDTSQTGTTMIDDTDGYTHVQYVDAYNEPM